MSAEQSMIETGIVGSGAGRPPARRQLIEVEGHNLDLHINDVLWRTSQEST
jgi:hypothetical protein